MFGGSPGITPQTANTSPAPDKQRSRPQVAQVVTFSWASRREAANHEEQKQETETGSVENQARPSGSGSRQSSRFRRKHKNSFDSGVQVPINAGEMDFLVSDYPTSPRELIGPFRRFSDVQWKAEGSIERLSLVAPRPAGLWLL